MAKIVEVPKLGLTMERGVVTNWRKREGEYVKKGEVLFELETDKINSEVESPDDGFVLKILINEGEEADVLVPACIIGKKGETIDEYLKSSPSAGRVQKESEDKKKEYVKGKDTIIDDGIIKISPLAKRLAGEHGIDITRVKPSGADGRIVKDDIFAAISESDDAAGYKKEQDIYQLTGIRKVIAQKMYESKRTIPHVYFRTTVDASNMIATRERYDDKPSFNDIIIKAVGVAIEKFPDVNVSFIDDKIFKHKEINIGLAVSLEKGLVVPVVKNVDMKSVEEIKKETRRLIEKARGNKLEINEVHDGTFTISNLGMFEIDEFSAIINPPESAILAVGRIQKRVCVNEGKIEVRPEVFLTLSVDHRTVDGEYAARFLETIKRVLETVELDKM